MIVCPTCSTPNPDGATNCSVCGSPLGGAKSTNRYPMALPPGTRLNGGAFSVGRVLGQGGFGITYKGNDINLARLVAVKELFPDGSRRQGLIVVPPHNVSESEWKTTRDEFIEEARTVARFRHPGIVNVYFVWEENGTAYQAMEFLDGQSAGGMVEKGKLTEAQAVPIIERVADALEVMHASGFIHRDLKPDNIVQTNDGRTVLIDFGTAKQFVREKTQKLNPVLTPGYAPLEQYSSQARFDHRLDIYALGATLYHLLTGEIPVSAVERAAGVELPSVRDKNPSVSQSVSDAIERAMAIKVGERFNSAREFAQALRAPKQTPAPSPQQSPRIPPQNTPSPRPVPQQVQPAPTPPPSPRDGANPYLSQIRALNQGLKEASNAPTFAGQARLDTIDRDLKPLVNWKTPAATNCPSCHKDAIKVVTGNFSGSCPFDGSPLSRIEWPVGKCAICRVGTLAYHALPPNEFFCAVCRRAPVSRVEKPGFLGLISVQEFECPACHAQYLPISSNAARLKQVEAQYGQTPLLGQTCTYTQWSDAAGASGQLADCSNCRARFIEQKNGNLLLAAWDTDPFGIAASVGHKSLSLDEWARLASGAANETATHRCPTCHARWKLDTANQTLALIRANAAEQARAEKWGFVIGPNYPINYPIKSWNAKISGKASGEVGRICGNCRTEFDLRPQNAVEKFALVATNNPLLGARSTLVLEWSDWHRITQKLPLSTEERTLRDEERKLLADRDTDRKRQAEFADSRRRDINGQLDGLYKRSAIEGFANMNFSARDAKPGERILWASRATIYKYRSRERNTFWDRDNSGRLILSDTRLWLEQSRSYSLAEVAGIEIQYQSRSPILVVQLSIRQRPLGFGIDPTDVEVTIEGLTRRLLFDVHDVAAMIKRLI